MRQKIISLCESSLWLLIFFEVSIKGKLGFDNVCSALAKCLGVPVENLVNESAYWVCLSRSVRLQSLLELILAIKVMGA